jgi:hypothetical protein
VSVSSMNREAALGVTIRRHTSLVADECRFNSDLPANKDIKFILLYLGSPVWELSHSEPSN